MDYDKLLEILKKAVRFYGVDIVQLRDKKGQLRETLKFAKNAVKYIKGKIPFIVNDRIDIALASEADGVHLGQDDLPIKEARKMAGKSLIIGSSCQNLLQALKAEKEGADYIGFGSVL